MFKSTSDNAKQLRILANVANSTLSEFQGMAYGAKAFGIEQDKLGDILKDVNDRIGDFVSTGGGPMADFFEKIGPQIGVTVEQFKKLSGPQALQLYYDSLQKANLSQADMTFYMEAMASDATNLIPLLRDNGRLLGVMSQEARELGVVMGDIDIAQLEAANKQFTRAKAVIEGAGNAISVEFAPYVDAALDSFVEMSKEAGGFGAIAEAGFGKAAKVVGFFADMVHGLKVVFKGIELAVSFAASTMITAFEASATVVGKVIDFQIGQINNLIDTLNLLPGVDIATVDTIGDSAFMRGIHTLGDEGRRTVEELAKDLHDLAMQPMPSDGVEAFLETIKQKSQEAAIEVAKVAAGVTSNDDPNLGPDAKTEAILSKYATEQELLRAHLEEMAIIGNEFDSKKFEDEDQWRKVRELAIREHVDKVNSLREMERSSAIGIAQSMGESLMSLAQGHSRKAFELGKKVSRASAAIKGTEAAISAWQAGMSTGGPYAPAVAAAYTAASLAKTGALIRNINAQSFGGGAIQSNAGGSGIPSVSTPSGGGGGSTGGGQQSQGSVAINLPRNAIIRGDALLDLIEEEVNNGRSVKFLRGD